MALPSSIVCFKSVENKKYLRYRDDNAHSHGLLQFSGETAMDSFSQFQVIYSKGGSESRFVHLLSRYTNKYLVRWSPNHYWITASANEQNDDHSNWGCTLFEPISVYDDDDRLLGVRLKHVQLNNYVSLFKDIGAPFESCLFAGSHRTDPNSYDIFTVTDWATIHKLPKTVAFKGDNNKFLGGCLIEGKHYLQFAYDHPHDEDVPQEVFTSPDGTVMIKSKSNGKYWRLDDDHSRIVVDVDEPITPSNVDSMFRINVVDTNVVALLNMKNTLYCKRASDCGDRGDLLSADAENVDANTLLRVTTLKH